MCGDVNAIAQLVMKTKEGNSILTSGTITAENAGAGDLDQDRVNTIRDKLASLGFEVVTGNLNTLSITGPEELFEETFGISPTSALESNVPAHSVRIPEDLSSFVADVFVTPLPETFP